MLGLLIFCLLGCVGTGYACVLAAQDFREHRRMRREGVTVEGTITARRKQRMYTHRDTNASYFVTYQYVFEGRHFTHEQRVSKQHYEEWDLSMPVVVRLLPSEPSVAEVLDDALERRGAPWALFFVILAMLFFAVGFLGLLAQLVNVSVLHPTL